MFAALDYPLRFLTMAVAISTNKLKVTKISGLTATSLAGNPSKNITRNGLHLPKIQDSAKSKKTINSSSSGNNVSTIISKRKQNDEQLLSGRLSRISLQNGSNSRKFSSRNEPVSVEGIIGCIRNGITKHIVVMTGAGISTPSGIPDFRTPGTGLYDNLKQYRIPYPEAIFDIEYFHLHPKPFFALAKELYPNGKYRPNYVHYFLRLLHDKGLLHRLYTQNIDGLERSAGIPQCKLVEAHGTFLTASCTRCGESQKTDDVRAAIFSDKLPRCFHCRGIVKPDIVFFGEDLPKRFYLHSKDFHNADLLLVLGTSLEVEPFAGIADGVRLNVPRLLFNRELVGPFRSKLQRKGDVAMIGDITEQVKKFVELLDWTKDLEQLISQSESVKSEVSDQKSLHEKESTGAQKTNEENSHQEVNALGLPRKGGEQDITKNVATVDSCNTQSSCPGDNKNNSINNNKLPAFHVQKELFRSSKVPSDSSQSTDSETSSSDDDFRK